MTDAGGRSISLVSSNTGETLHLNYGESHDLPPTQSVNLMVYHFQKLKKTKMINTITSLYQSWTPTEVFLHPIFVLQAIAPVCSTDNISVKSSDTSTP